MNILIVNNPYFIPELRALGHRVEHLGFGEESFNDPYQFCEIEKLLERLPADFEPDLLIYVDNSRPAKVFGIERLKIPTIFYSIDAHIHIDWHIYFGAVFDHVFVAQKDYLERFSQLSASCSWLPLWGPDLQNIPDTKTTDVSFRGTLDVGIHPKRLEFFKNLSAITPVDYASGPYIEVYSKSKIVINELINNDLNFRVFEGMACGAMLMSPITSNGLLELFEPEIDFVPYETDNPEDAADKIKFYLQNEAARIKIAQSGFKKFRSLHTLQHRIQSILDVASKLKPSNSPEKLLASSILNLFFVKEFRTYSETMADLLLARSIKSVCDYSSLEVIETNKTAAALMAIGNFISASKDLSLKNSFQHALRFIFSNQSANMIIVITVVKLLHLAGNPVEAKEIAALCNLDFESVINQ